MRICLKTLLPGYIGMYISPANSCLAILDRLKMMKKQLTLPQA